MKNDIQKINTFSFHGSEQKVNYLETTQVKSGVTCDIYEFLSDSSKDLALITIAPGVHTPLQKVLTGKKTIEGYISGKGKLTITKANGQKVINRFDGQSRSYEYIIEIGDQMQWQADQDSELLIYEICYPPYQDGRFENIEI